MKCNRDRIQIEYDIDEGMIGLVNNKNNQEKHERQICRYVITGEIDKADKKLKLTKTLLNNNTGYINVALDGNEDIISIIKKMLSKILNIRGWLCVNEGEILGSILNDIDKNDKMEELQAINNEIFEEIKNDNHSNFIVNKDTNIIINGGLNEEAKENNLNTSKINAEIKIKDDKVVISFYEPSEERLWICEKEANNSSCRKYVDPTDEADVGNDIVLENNNNENKYINKNECYRHSFVDKKKVKEVEIDIKLLQEGKGRELKVGKITFDLVNSETFKDEYEYKITECKEKTKDYDYLLNGGKETLKICDKINILNFLLSCCEKKINKDAIKNNNIKDTDLLHPQSDKVLALCDALKKKMAEYFSFYSFISQKNESPGMKCIKINLPYNQQDLVFYIDEQEKQIYDFSNINSEVFHHKKDDCNKISYLDETNLRDYIKQQLCTKCYNDNDDIDEVKQVWKKKIEKFVNDLDLSQILMKEVKNNDVIDSLSQNPCVRALCCI